MTPTRVEQRLRDAVLEAMIPSPGRGLPAMAELDRRAFWERFDAAAPVHLVLAMRAAALALGAVLPRALGHRGTLETLPPEAQARVLSRAARLPVFADLVEIAKIVACLAYFDDDAVEDAVRGAR